MNGTNNFTQYDEIFILHDLEKQAKRVKANSEKTVQICTRIIDEAHAYLNFIEAMGEQSERGDYLIQEQFKTLLTEERLSIYASYQELSEPLTFGYQRSIPQARKDGFHTFNDYVEGIQVVIDNDELFIKLPLLWSKFSWVRSQNGKPVTSDHLHWFASSLDAALSEIYDEIPKLVRKHIHYLFVVDIGKKAITDTDNYDTKAITDVIVSHTLGGDTPHNCSFSQVTLPNYLLKEGTYITVGPNFGNPPSAKQNETRCRHFFNRLKN